MKQTILLSALGLASLGASAQGIVANVLSSTPVIQQVQVPRQVCSQPAPVMAPPTSGGGGLLGALVGGGVGSTIGHGSGNAAAIVAGTLLGAVVGNNVEAGNLQAQAAAQSMPYCTTQMTLENRTVGYNVTYEYGGQQQTVQMPYDPGPTVRLQVTPMAQGPAQQGPVAQGPAEGGAVVAPPLQAGGVQPAAEVVQPATMAVPPPVAYAPYPAYQAYPVPVYPAYGYPYYRPYFPVGISLGFGFSSHHHHGGGHRHRR